MSTPDSQHCLLPSVLNTPGSGQHTPSLASAAAQQVPSVLSTPLSQHAPAPSSTESAGQHTFTPLPDGRTVVVLLAVVSQHISVVLSAAPSLAGVVPSAQQILVSTPAAEVEVAVFSSAQHTSPPLPSWTGVWPAAQQVLVPLAAVAICPPLQHTSLPSILTTLSTLQYMAGVGQLCGRSAGREQHLVSSVAHFLPVGHS